MELKGQEEVKEGNVKSKRRRGEMIGWFKDIMGQEIYNLRIREVGRWEEDVGKSEVRRRLPRFAGEQRSSRAFFVATCAVMPTHKLC